MPYDQTTAIDHTYRASTQQLPAPQEGLHQKHQDKLLKSTTSLNGKHQPNYLPLFANYLPHLPNHYPTYPTIIPLAQLLSHLTNHYPSCPTITPLCQLLSLLPNHYPSLPTITPLCPTIIPFDQPFPHFLRCHNQPFDFIKVSHLFCF